MHSPAGDKRCFIVGDRPDYSMELFVWLPRRVARHQLMSSAAYADFQPDTALINRYEVGASLGLHQDKDELDLTQPIVSVSLGIAATFQFGGLSRTDKAFKLQLIHGDVVVWGGDARLKFHGILPLKASDHPATGKCRINLTLRKAG